MTLIEANITNLDELVLAINKVLNEKDVPEYVGSMKNPIRAWFLRHYIQAIKDDVVDIKHSLVKHQYQDGEPDYMKKSDIMDFTGDLSNDVVNEINHIVDYFSTLESNDLRKIEREPYSVIRTKVSEWDREMTSSSDDTDKEDVAKKKMILGTDYRVVSQLGSLKWVKLLTPRCKDVEGDYMGHCVGGETYEQKDIYSLWDNKNRSHVTIEANDTAKTIRQIKGKGNVAPVEKYIPATIDFVANAMLKGYKVVGDGENVEMVKYENEYHFDNLDVLPEKFRNKSVFRKWVDEIYPTSIYPKQQKAIADILKRIVEV